MISPFIDLMSVLSNDDEYCRRNCIIFLHSAYWFFLNFSWFHILLNANSWTSVDVDRCLSKADQLKLIIRAERADHRSCGRTLIMEIINTVGFFFIKFLLEWLFFETPSIFKFFSKISVTFTFLPKIIFLCWFSKISIKIVEGVFRAGELFAPPNHHGVQIGDGGGILMDGGGGGARRAF